MSESVHTRATWSNLLSDLCAQPAARELKGIPDESTFHEYFELLCIEVREKDPQRMLARFIRQHVQLIAIVSAIDQSVGLVQPHTLNSVFWSVAFAAVHLALSHNKKKKLFSEYFHLINDNVPAFGPEVSLFPFATSVQKPLQVLFKEYIECYLAMLVQLASHTATSTFETFTQRTSLASSIFAESKRLWEEAIKEATEEQAKLAATLPSVPNGSLGPLNQFTTRVAFEWLDTLGGGGNGRVFKVRESSTGTIYAKKAIPFSDAQSRRRVEKQVQNEVAIMQRLSHHHIASVKFHIREADNFSIFMLPVADYDLLAFLKNCIRNDFPRQELKHLTSWFGCLVSALAFAHSQKIKHEDIKPGNVLIKDHQPYLADFGCAKDFSAYDQSTSTDALGFGTPIYWAPERPPRGRLADVFSLGCVFSEMLTVRQHQTLEEYQRWRYAQHKDNPYAFRENLTKVTEWIDDVLDAKDHVGKLLASQTKLMLDSDQNQRSSAKAVKKQLLGEADYVFCSTCY